MEARLLITQEDYLKFAEFFVHDLLLYFIVAKRLIHNDGPPLQKSDPT